ncbi:hypothetical protein [Tychonema sp. LEGE 07203]|uniref:hypothetical protein n=1 Tax=Tychonema sp. LEGE 07203 TaxID=1828671 RepID=UPI001D14DB11|nr:hypothetical protein [Tychonema sp. LEGE 07203]
MSDSLLEINLDHIEVVASLPLHHRDPFDRLIISLDGQTLVSESDDSTVKIWQRGL